jgi:hypothetical protein
VTDFLDCGNTFSNGGGPAPDGTAGCDMPCYGNTSETCGGADRLSVYDYDDAIASLPPTGWISLGCYTDEVGDRTLTTEIYSIPGSNMTIQACLDACLIAKYPLAGVEYAGECCMSSSFLNLQY